MRRFAFSLLVFMLAGLIVCYPVFAEKRIGYTSVSDGQMESFLDKLDRDTGKKYSNLVSKIRQAWKDRNLPAFNSLSKQLAYLLLKSSSREGKYQPTGSCQQLGGYNCYCGTSVSCCCFYSCSSFINICIGIDYGAIVAAGGGGGGTGGGGEYFMCRPSQGGMTN